MFLHRIWIRRTGLFSCQYSLGQARVAGFDEAGRCRFKTMSSCTSGDSLHSRLSSTKEIIGGKVAMCLSRIAGQLRSALAELRLSSFQPRWR